jgi:3-hydroxyacyl-CoA dehydrogenase/enoyl-CoA hydratase/3-hydroxybutyryl-CoA epimerase
VQHFLLESNPLGRALLFNLAKKSVLSKTKGHYPAPLVALDVLKNTATMNLKDGLNYEIDAFVKAIPNKFQNAISLIKLFFANEALKKNPGLPEGAKAKDVKSGAVIGAGTMGAGIAWLFSNADIPVRFKDINWKVVAKGYESAYGIYKKLLKIRKIKPYEVARKFQLLSGTTDYSGFANVDLVIEAATENLELKHKIFAELESVVRTDAIIASNTSSLPISEMSKHMKHPERFLGMHFFNPPNRMPLVEIIAGEKTSPEALATAVELCKRFKKVPLIVRDCPGFLVNRIFAAAANESSWMLQEGVEMERLDKIVTDFGMPMGPCALSDEVGNDVAYKVFHTFEDAYGSRMRSPQIVKAMFDAGLLGKKTSKGYYIYDGKNSKENPEVKALLKNIPSEKLNLSDEEILDRFLLGMVNEAARCLEEGVVNDPMYVDMALLYGMGFPPFRAGLLHYADKRGLANIVDRLNTLAKRYGDRFTPCNKLVSMAKENRSFYNPTEKFSERATCSTNNKACACSHK